MTIGDLQRLIRGIERISFREFSGVMNTAPGATSRYVERQWERFQDNPGVFMLDVYPESCGTALFNMAWEKGIY